MPYNGELSRAREHVVTFYLVQHAARSQHVCRKVDECKKTVKCVKSTASRRKPPNLCLASLLPAVAAPPPKLPVQVRSLLPSLPSAAIILDTSSTASNWADMPMTSLSSFKSLVSKAEYFHTEVATRAAEAAMDEGIAELELHLECMQHMQSSRAAPVHTQQASLQGAPTRLPRPSTAAAAAAVGASMSHQWQCQAEAQPHCLATHQAAKSLPVQSSRVQASRMLQPSAPRSLAVDVLHCTNATSASNPCPQAVLQSFDVDGDDHLLLAACEAAEAQFAQGQKLPTATQGPTETRHPNLRCIDQVHGRDLDAVLEIDLLSPRLEAHPMPQPGCDVDRDGAFTERCEPAAPSPPLPAAENQLQEENHAPWDSGNMELDLEPSVPDDHSGMRQANITGFDRVDLSAFSKLMPGQAFAFCGIDFDDEDMDPQPAMVNSNHEQLAMMMSSEGAGQQDQCGVVPAGENGGAPGLPDARVGMDALAQPCSAPFAIGGLAGGMEIDIVCDDDHGPSQDRPAPSPPCSRQEHFSPNMPGSPSTSACIEAASKACAPTNDTQGTRIDEPMEALASASVVASTEKNVQPAARQKPTCRRDSSVFQVRSGACPDRSGMYHSTRHPQTACRE